MKLDSYDLKILDLLQHDGGLSNQEIAERIGLSPSPCSRRIKQLEEAGVIRERVARLSPQALGLELTVLLHIRMDRHTPERFEQFEKIVRRYPEVQECYLITGQEADYQLKIIVPGMDAYQDFLLNKITRIDGVIGVHSSFVLRKPIDTTALPLTYAQRALQASARETARR
ncbi:MAG: Lrp/AsnC family transcriptional regulator [Gammaproteobacteria bacterium]|nr:AsnC family transcriptional regulator [Gammaproteobacteria bacterium]